MLHTYSLGKCYLESGWAIHPLSGSLIKFQSQNLESFQSKQIPKIVVAALKNCDNPFLLSPNFANYKDPDEKIVSKIKSNFLFLNKIKNLNFYISLLITNILSSNICNTSSEIFSIINSFNNDITFNTCLTKCLTVAKCSRSFKKNGVIFIGAHLPLQDMHAWIIEGDTQPDIEDRAWINYLPLMALTYHRN